MYDELVEDFMLKENLSPALTCLVAVKLITSKLFEFIVLFAI